MDMLNQLGRLVNGEEDADIRRAVENAFPAEAHPTSSNLLLERIMLRAEAAPQLAATRDADTTYHPEVDATAESSPSVLAQQRRNLVENLSTSTLPVQQQLQKLRSINWELYHEYLERNIHKVNATSGLHF